MNIDSDYNISYLENTKDHKELAESIPVLVYHGVVDNFDGSNILLADFRDQMFALKEAGYQTVTLQDFYGFTQGNKELPEKSFLLTFDDGRKDSYYPVDPILDALDYNAVMFVITKFSLEEKGGNYYLSDKELKRMYLSGRWEIQAHTRDGHELYKIDQEGHLGHFYSNKLWLDDQQRLETDEEFKYRISNDFLTAKNDLKSTLNIDAIAFAYPFGDFGQDSINYKKSLDVIDSEITKLYKLTFYQVWPGKGYIFNYQNNSNYPIKRIEVGHDWTPANLLRILESGKNKGIPYYDNFHTYTGWIKTWGKLTYINNGMILEATRDINGASMFLDGSALWKDYLYKAKIHFKKGSSFSLLGHYMDENNYIECNYNLNNISINIVEDGKKINLSQRNGMSIYPNSTRTLSIKFVNTDIICYLDDKPIISAYKVKSRNNQGGIGIKIWDPVSNNSKITVKEITIEEIPM